MIEHCLSDLDGLAKDDFGLKHFEARQILSDDVMGIEAGRME